MLVVAWSILRAHAPQRSSFPYPRLFFGDFLITFTRILLQVIGHIILCPLTINPANIIANVSVNNSRTGSASEIIMFNAQLNPRHNVNALISAIETMVDIPVILLGKNKIFSTEEIGSILKIAEPHFALSFEEHYVYVHVNHRGMWGLEIIDCFSGQINFYLGAGYQKGILSGSKPLSEWGLDPEGFYYFIEDFSRANLRNFYSIEETNYSKMVDRLAELNKWAE